MPMWPLCFHKLPTEYQYVCRCVPEAEKHLGPVEAAIRKRFFPALFRVDAIDDKFHWLLSNGVKQGGIAIRNPVEAAPVLHQSLLEATELLIKTLQENRELNSAAHKATVQKAGADRWMARIESEKLEVTDLGKRKYEKVKRQLDQLAGTGSWLTTMPNKFDGTELS